MLCIFCKYAWLLPLPPPKRKHTVTFPFCYCLPACLAIVIMLMVLRLFTQETAYVYIYAYKRIIYIRSFRYLLSTVLFCTCLNSITSSVSDKDTYCRIKPTVLICLYHIKISTLCSMCLLIWISKFDDWHIIYVYAMWNCSKRFVYTVQFV